MEARKENLNTMIGHNGLNALKRARAAAAAGLLLAAVWLLPGCATSRRFTSSLRPGSHPPASLKAKLNITEVVPAYETTDAVQHRGSWFLAGNSERHERRWPPADAARQLMATAERLHPDLFSREAAAVPVSLKLGAEFWPDAYTWTYFFSFCTGGVLPAIRMQEARFTVSIELHDERDGVLLADRSSFERRDVQWRLGWTPLVFLNVPGRSDRPKIHSGSGINPLRTSAQFTRECYVEAVVQAVLNADADQLEQTYAARRRRFADNALAAGRNKPDNAAKPAGELPGYDPKRLHALVIGIDKYKHWPALKCAVNDARAVATVLKQDYGFARVKLLTNEQATREGILGALDACGKLTDKDSLLIYYAGHGWMDNKTKTGYWVPADARRDQKFDYVPNSQIAEDNFKKYNVKHLLVVADSCFSGTLLRGQKVVRDDAFSLPDGFRKPSRWVLTSGGLKPVPDGQVDHSPFAARLLQYLKFTKRKSFGVLDLHVYLRQNLDTAPVAGPLSTPRHMAGGEFVFRRTE